MSKTKVFFEHDGSSDDFLSLMLLLTIREIEIVGINVTPADCFLNPALITSYRILDIFGKKDIPIGKSNETGINTFPAEWRAKPKVINMLPDFINRAEPAAIKKFASASKLLIKCLEETDNPIRILITGPCSNVTRALAERPDLKEKVMDITWMGGAFHAKGNVQVHEHNGSAEWNVFWDARSAYELLELDLKLTFVPLDVTDNVPVNEAFLKKLATQNKFLLSDIATQLWAITTDSIPSYYYTYYMWDILATTYVIKPDLFQTRKIKAKISLQSPNEGQTMISDNGTLVEMVSEVNKASFYNFVLEQFKTF